MIHFVALGDKSLHYNESQSTKAHIMCFYLELLQYHYQYQKRSNKAKMLVLVSSSL